MDLQGYREGRESGSIARSPQQATVFGGLTPREFRLARLSDGLDGRINIVFHLILELRPTPLDRGGAASPPWAIAMTADGRKLAACGPAGSLTLYDLGTRNPPRIIRPAQAEAPDLQFLAFGPTDDAVITTDSIGLLQLWDLKAGRPTFAAKCPDHDIRAASCRGDRLTLVSGGYRWGGGKVEPLVIETYSLPPVEAAP